MSQNLKVFEGNQSNQENVDHYTMLGTKILSACSMVYTWNLFHPTVLRAYELHKWLTSQLQYFKKIFVCIDWMARHITQLWANCIKKIIKMKAPKRSLIILFLYTKQILITWSIKQKLLELRPSKGRKSSNKQCDAFWLGWQSRLSNCVAYSISHVCRSYCKLAHFWLC